MLKLLLPEIAQSPGKYALAIAGESGSGKSELAAALAERLLEKGFKSIILQQDDYFVYPPKTNAAKRRQDIQWVGASEVRLDLLDRNIQEALDNKDEITKPLVIYQEDRIIQEAIKLQGVKVVIAEGTYTTLLQNVHARIFIDRTYVDTKAARLQRAREAPDPWIEEILAVEHRIISAHKSRADVIITRDYSVVTRRRKNDQQDSHAKL
ncbi:MAG: helicase HerA domain-containing protein [Candidatus Acidiferrales bacterium]